MMAIQTIAMTLLACLLMIQMTAIGIQVVCIALSINPLVTFTEQLPFLGDAITLISLLDLQWHLLVITGCLLYTSPSPRDRG